MRIRTKMLWAMLTFALASGGVMGWCYLNIRQEEAAFIHGRRAVKTLAAVHEMEYFLVRQARLLENYVLLGEEADRMQLVLTIQQSADRLKEWKKSVVRGDALGTEWAAAESVHHQIAGAGNKVRLLMNAGQRKAAMALVEGEFSTARTKALASYAALKKRAEAEKVNAEENVGNKLRLSHLGLMGGLALLTLLGMGLITLLFRSVLKPIRDMRQWADRMARGEKTAPLAGFRGKNELTELAASVGEMAIQLTRPRAMPPTTKVAAPVAPAPTKTFVPATEPMAIPLVPTPSKPEPTPPKPTEAPLNPPPEVSTPRPGADLPVSLPTVGIASVGASPTPPGESASPRSTEPLPPPKTVPVPDLAEGFQLAKPATSGPASTPEPQSATDFEQAVDEFRDILTQMSRKE